MVKSTNVAFGRFCIQKEKVMLNINEFKSAVHKYDLERPNLFTVDISIPSIILNDPGGSELVSKIENGKLVKLFCKNVNLPGINLQTAETIRYGIGPSIRMPVRGSLNDISMTFLNDSKSNVYSFFFGWINSIYRQAQNNNAVPGSLLTYIHPFKKDYQTDVTLTSYHGKPGQFGGSGLLQTVVSVASAAAGVPFLGSLLGSRAMEGKNLVAVKKYNIMKMYPTNISDIGLSSGASDSVTEFTVNFTYQSFELKVLK